VRRRAPEACWRVRLGRGEGRGGRGPRAALLLVAVAVLLAGFACAGATEVLFFFETGCPHCARVEAVLEEIAEAKDGLTVARYDVASPEGRELLSRLLSAYGAEMGPVPLVFVSNVAMVRGTFYGLESSPVTLSDRSAEMKLREVVERAIDADAPSPLVRLAAVATEAILVTAKDCPDCERLDALLADLGKRHSELGLRRVSADDPEGARLFERLLRFLRVRGSPPALFVGDTALVGGTLYPAHGKAVPFDYGEGGKAALEPVIERAIADRTPSPLSKLQVREKVTLWAVVGAAVLDSINPCDFAVMILLLGRLLVIGRRGKVLWAGLAFAAAIYLVYFLMGFALYTILGVSLGTRALRSGYILAVSCVAILVGIWQMKDLLWYGKWLSIEVPERWKPSLKRITSSVFSVPGVFVAGLVDALFLAPCTSGPYIAILSLLSQTTSRVQGVVLLLLYNLIFVLPLIAIAFTVQFGFTTTARAERWRTAKTGKLHFVTGVVMFLLGVGMIVGLQLGYI